MPSGAWSRSHAPPGSIREEAQAILAPLVLMAGERRGTQPSLSPTCSAGEGWSDPARHLSRGRERRERLIVPAPPSLPTVQRSPTASTECTQALTVHPLSSVSPRGRASCSTIAKK
jgi:hypothetical protein